MQKILTEAFGVARLGFDAGAALVAIAIAVPVAFAFSEGYKMGRAARREIVPAPNQPERIHDLGTVIQLR
ncbi:hypothetical protein ACWEK5_47540 [Rhodococcus koreensis]